MGKKENPTRWVANGLPRKGWRVTGVEDTKEYGLKSCDWCGTPVRYVFGLIHDETGCESEAGCICAEHLSEEYSHRPSEVLKDFKDKQRKKNRKPPKWLESYNGNLYYRTKGTVVTVIQNKNGRWLWVKDSVFSNTFATDDEAIRDAEINGR